MAREKTDADRRYNERRRIRRAAERLAKQVKLQIGKAQQETLRVIKELKEQISQSYFDKKSKTYKQTLSELTNRTKSGREYEANISKQIKGDSLAENLRKTKMQEAYFRSAAGNAYGRVKGIDTRTPEQKLARAEQSFFYAKTRVLWLGGSPERKNENILAALANVRLESGRKIQNLADAVQWVKENYGEEYPTLEKTMQGKYDTEDIDFQGEEEAEDASPEPISRKEFRSLGVAF